MGKSVLLRVSPKFADGLKKKHKWFNDKVAHQYFKKDMDLIDFTDLLSNGIDESFELMMGKKTLLYPMRKNKRRISFDTELLKF